MKKGLLYSLIAVVGFVSFTAQAEVNTSVLFAGGSLAQQESLGLQRTAAVDALLLVIAKYYTNDAAVKNLFRQLAVGLGVRELSLAVLNNDSLKGLIAQLPYGDYLVSQIFGSTDGQKATLATVAALVAAQVVEVPAALQ